MNRHAEKARRHKRLDRGGLSLLEVIVATVILAVSSLMLVKIISTADRNAQRAERRLQGQLICQNKLEEIQCRLLPLESSDLSPTIYYPDWQCKIDIQEWSSQAYPADGNVVLVEIIAFYLPMDELGAVASGVDAAENRPVFTLQRLLRRGNSDSASEVPDLLGGFER